MLPPGSHEYFLQHAAVQLEHGKNISEPVEHRFGNECVSLCKEQQESSGGGMLFQRSFSCTSCPVFHTSTPATADIFTILVRYFVRD